MANNSLQWLDGIPWISSASAFPAAARELDALDWPGEFILSPELSAVMVCAATQAGFMPMSAVFTVAEGVERAFFTPKLHTLRCLLSPGQVHVSRTARRQAAVYTMSLDRDFPAVLQHCIAVHGQGWLTPDLCSVFLQLQQHQQLPRQFDDGMFAGDSPAIADRVLQLVSVELWKDAELAAGELGYRIGSVYTSLSGFYLVPGAGTVQLTLLGGLLANAGCRLWDLGMPMAYKQNLGGSLLPRREYLPLLQEAYARPAFELAGLTTEL
ncbi:MAG: hypothetical protein KKC64_08960 [Spirochaetes bacterium]|nr:hypothetical protein [Spirochaetota bacterium]